MADTRALVLTTTEMAGDLAIRSFEKDPGISERRVGVVAVTEIGGNEFKARQIESENSARAMEAATRVQAESQKEIAKMQAESQERRDRISADSQAQLARIEKDTQIELAKIPARHATLRWSSTMIVFAVVALGTIWALIMHPQSWNVVLPSGFAAELLIGALAFLRGKERLR